jgi:hypothetical protein
VRAQLAVAAVAGAPLLATVLQPPAAERGPHPGCANRT